LKKLEEVKLPFLGANVTKRNRKEKVQVLRTMAMIGCLISLLPTLEDAQTEIKTDWYAAYLNRKHSN